MNERNHGVFYRSLKIQFNVTIGIDLNGLGDGIASKAVSGFFEDIKILSKDNTIDHHIKDALTDGTIVKEVLGKS